MNLWKLARRSLSFYWRTNLAVLLAATASAAILTGALVVGDSVRHSLRMMAKARLGTTEFALIPQNRFFRAELADDLATELNTAVVPVLRLRGLIANSDGTKRANSVAVLGVDERFFKVGEGGNPVGDAWGEGVVLNQALATRLGARVGDEVVLRIAKPGLMPRDVPIAPTSDLSIASRLAVRAVAGNSQFGRFSLQANQVVPLNVFVPIRWLQEKLGRSEEANMLLVAGSPRGSMTVEMANKAIRTCWQLADAGLEFRELDRQDVLQIRSRRIFIDDSFAEAAMDAAEGAVGILTYFVNQLRVGDRTTPYSVVTAMERSNASENIIPADMKDDEILINQWLAEDLGAEVGDQLELTYFVVGPTRKLDEEKASFTVRGVLPMQGAAVDPELMPDFPGLAHVENCRDWDPGIPIELDKIRPRDEDYWQQYRGTPKAFITLKAGQALWANRYGNLTAVRYPRSGASAERIGAKLSNAVDPASVGLFFQSVRERGLKASNEGTDFGQLFLGLSMFLIVAALVLMGLLFVFNVESRSEQVGMLMAVGLSQKLVRRLLFLEGGSLALLGTVAGAAAGLLYTKAMIYGLGTFWQAAISGSEMHFYAQASTLLAAGSGALAISMVAIGLTLRRQVSRPAHELLAGNLQWQFHTAGRPSKRRIGLWIAAVAVVGAAVLLIAMGAGNSTAVFAAFFGAGALLLIAGLGLCHAVLKMLAGNWKRPMVSLVGLGSRNSARRSGRSLAVIWLLACGIFLVIAVGANRRNPLAEPHKRDSGTGGFALFGESSISILQDLNSTAGRRAIGLDDDVLDQVEVVQIRVHDGDDASCFNLNRAQRPGLFAVEPEQLQRRGAFLFTEVVEGPTGEDAWNLLNRDCGENIVPAIGDYPTIIWALGKSIGDELDYTDEKGRPFRLRLVGMLKASILQGSLIIAEDEFVKRFPSQDGYRMFLVDAPQDKAEAVAGELSSALRDFGLALTPARQRLAAFSAVENTYLSIFQILGSLGLILGSVGLGLVVLRNMLDQRGELAMLQAVGLNKAALKRMVFYEHAGLLVCGLACGIVAALVAVSPALKSPAAQVPYFSLALTVIAIGVSGAVWIWLATKFALRGPILEALRSE